MNLAVEVKELVKVYPGGVAAVRGLSFVVEEGEIYGLIGPNGAGKTTTLRIIATLLKPTSGSVRVFGLDVVREAPRVRRIISYLPEEAGAYRNLTGYEYLSFMARLYAASRRDAEEMVEEAIRISGLGDRIHDKVKTYSKGMKRRLLLARTLMVRPRLAILDEPTSGLDVIHALHVRRVIRDYARSHGVTVLLSSHNMLEVEYLCSRVGIVHQGRLVAEGEPRRLIEEHGVGNLEEVFAKVVGGA
ncbi:MAG: multidrug ABC transporter ATP-binding protein [Thermoprotei archaeon]|nr:MAG: multidrug ABC transporter ATP-binding protein [Thermoprotei archaeon]